MSILIKTLSSMLVLLLSMLGSVFLGMFLQALYVPVTEESETVRTILGLVSVFIVSVVVGCTLNTIWKNK